MTRHCAIERKEERSFVLLALTGQVIGLWNPCRSSKEAAERLALVEKSIEHSDSRHRAFSQSLFKAVNKALGDAPASSSNKSDELLSWDEIFRQRLGGGYNEKKLKSPPIDWLNKQVSRAENSAKLQANFSYLERKGTWLLGSKEVPPDRLAKFQKYLIHYVKGTSYDIRELQPLIVFPNLALSKQASSDETRNLVPSDKLTVSQTINRGSSGQAQRIVGSNKLTVSQPINRGSSGQAQRIVGSDKLTVSQTIRRVSRKLDTLQKSAADATCRTPRSDNKTLQRGGGIKKSSDLFAAPPNSPETPRVSSMDREVKRIFSRRVSTLRDVIGLPTIWEGVTISSEGIQARTNDVFKMIQVKAQPKQSIARKLLNQVTGDQNNLTRLQKKVTLARNKVTGLQKNVTVAQNLRVPSSNTQRSMQKDPVIEAVTEPTKTRRNVQIKDPKTPVRLNRTYYLRAQHNRN